MYFECKHRQILLQSLEKYTERGSVWVQRPASRNSEFRVIVSFFNMIGEASQAFSSARSCLSYVAGTGMDYKPVAPRMSIDTS